MKRTTVAITMDDNWSYTSSYDLNKIRAAMINAGIAKATELNVSVVTIDSKCATNVRNAHAS